MISSQLIEGGGRGREAGLESLPLVGAGDWQIAWWQPQGFF